MANTADGTTADLNKWGRPNFAGRHRDEFDSRDGDWHPRWHPGSVLVTVAGFIIWWPLGLAALAYTIWSRKMGCWNNDGHDRGSRFANKMERMQYKMERMRGRMERRGFYPPSSSGNRAFDDYRMETLQRLEEEQTEFRDFLDRLRHAKDKEEFDQFMSQHRPPKTPPSDQPQG